MLNIEKNLSRFSIVLDENVHGVRILNPSNETRVRRQRGNRVTLDMEMTFETFRVMGQKGVDKTEKLHDPFILTKILVT